jgi:predicted transposase/invertase (TIGR01784 family)
MSNMLISFDYALRRLLRKKANYDVLEGFLSELFGYDVKVKDISESRTTKDVPVDRYKTIDIMIEKAKGEIMFVELQFNAEMDYFQRMLYGTSRTIIDRIEAEPYDVLPKIISINIVYFDFGYAKDYVYRVMSIFNGIHYDEDLQFVECQRDRYSKKNSSNICPEYYLLIIDKFDDNVKDKFDEWIYFLKHNSIKDEFTAKGLDKARQTLLYEALTPEEKKEYDHIADIHYQNQKNIFYSVTPKKI